MKDNIIKIIKNKKDLFSLNESVFKQFIDQYIKCFLYDQNVCKDIKYNFCFNYIKKNILIFLKKGIYILFLVYSKDNNFITSCLLKNNKEIKSLCVGTLYRNRGICGYIINYIINYVESNKITNELIIDCNKNNTAAIKCYKKYFSVYNENNEKIYFKKLLKL